MIRFRQDMKKLAITCTVCLVIAAIFLHRSWLEHRQAREAKAALIKMETNKPPRFKAEVPTESAKTSDSSNQLVVLVDERGGLKFNGQELGVTSDMGQLRAKLAQVFKERADHQPDRTVFVRASRRLSYAETAKVVQAVKEAGGDPVKLEVDELK
jgi:biopolymer transport protein ExbD